MSRNARTGRRDGAALLGGPPRDLLEAASDARARAYAPYSGFAVGAALRGASGRIIAGCTVENAAYSLGQCAEAVALGAMLLAGERRITEILLIGSAETPCAPCGGCRQRLAEFAPPATPVHMVGSSGAVRMAVLGDLLPQAFALEGAEPASSPTAAEAIRREAPGFVPLLGLVLGSGLGLVADAIEVQASLPFDRLPGFPRPTVPGHAGRLVLGRMAGVPLACLQGRIHLYEGHSAAAVNGLVRTLHGLGCRGLVLTNAAGSLRPDLPPGSLALIDDHINLMGTNPLIGANDERIGPRFVAMGEAYDPALRVVARRAAARVGLALTGGVYLALTGPMFETPAEIRACRRLGADLVGMSTVPEVISARHCGLRVLAVSMVTNFAAGMTPHPLSHAQTLEQAGLAAPALLRLLKAALPEIADALA